MRTHDWEPRTGRRYHRSHEAPTPAPIDDLASTVGDAVARLIRSLDPTRQAMAPLQPGGMWPGRSPMWSPAGWPGWPERTEQPAGERCPFCGATGRHRAHCHGRHDRGPWRHGRHRHHGGWCWHDDAGWCCEERDCWDDCDCDRHCGDGHEHGHWPKDWCGGCCDEPCGRCGQDPCHCACCIGDVDLVVYARVGETRVVPIRIENRRRRERQIQLELSPFTTKGGNPTPVTGQILAPTAFTLEPCSEHESVLVVRVGLPNGEPEPQGAQGATAGAGEAPDRSQMTRAQLLDEARRAGVQVAGNATKEDVQRALAAAESSAAEPATAGQAATRQLRDVDDCHVAVADVRMQGCDTRPVRVAVAVLPRDCGPYEVRCDCGCC